MPSAMLDSLSDRFADTYARHLSEPLPESLAAEDGAEQEYRGDKAAWEVLEPLSNEELLQVVLELIRVGHDRHFDEADYYGTRLSLRDMLLEFIHDYLCAQV